MKAIAHFIAGVFGAVLAKEGAHWQKQWAAAAATLALSLSFSLLFWVVSTLPDTIPVALASVLFWNRSAWVAASDDADLAEHL